MCVEPNKKPGKQSFSMARVMVRAFSWSCCKGSNGFNSVEGSVLSLPHAPDIAFFAYWMDMDRANRI